MCRHQMGGIFTDRDRRLQAMALCDNRRKRREGLSKPFTMACRFGVPGDMIKQTSLQVNDFETDEICPAARENELLTETGEVATSEGGRINEGLIFGMGEQLQQIHMTAGLATTDTNRTLGAEERTRSLSSGMARAAG
jgi:hypothetical protein